MYNIMSSNPKLQNYKNHIIVRFIRVKLQGIIEKNLSFCKNYWNVLDLVNIYCLIDFVIIRVLRLNHTFELCIK